MALHPLDLAVLVAYLAFVLGLGFRAFRRSQQNQEGYYLAGRKLGKLYQFLLNFGNSTDSNGAVSTASLVYQQGVSGMWLGFQLIFVNPYYWFMNTWFRRVRLVTTADLFEDRLGARKLAAFYALFQSLSAMFVIIGFGNLVTYKISAALVVKPEATWSAGERASIDGYRALHTLEKAAKAAPLSAADQAQLTTLRERQARGELKSTITALPELPFYIGYTLIIGAYVIMGGMTATAMNEALQGALTLLFSIILIPLGLSAIGGWDELGKRVPDAMFDLLSTSTGAQQINGLVLCALIVVAVVQINGIIGNMGISGSAKDEYAARFGAVSGTYGKRVLMILWAFAGLIAIAMYQGADSLADADAAWGAMSRQLLGPGLLGLMLVGLLANNMDTVAAQTLSVSALFVRNVLSPLRGELSEAAAVTAGRWMIGIALSIGILAALSMDNVVSALMLVQTVNVPFGAAVVLMFFWRRLTVPALWAGLLLAISFNVVAPLLLGKMDAVRTHPTLVARSVDDAGRPQPVYFESVARAKPDDPTSALEGRGRLHLELVALRTIGLPVETMTGSGRFAARFFFDAALPFILIIGISLMTRAPERARIDQFFGRMKTPVGATPELEAAAMEETRRNPGRFDHTKLFPNSAWEFTKWDRVDTVGFLACCAVSGAILGFFALVLRWASGG
jgi:Na+/proline symporter